MTQKLYCNANCREGFHTDRRYGLIYSPCIVLKSETPAKYLPKVQPYNDLWYLTDWETASKIAHTCMYCGAYL